MKIIITMKQCNKCKIEKELTEFYKRPGSKDGYRNDCKECQLKNKKYDKEKTSEYNKKYRIENKEKLIKLDKDNYTKNKEKIKERTNNYYYLNKDKLKEQAKEYRLLHKNKHKDYLKENKEKIKKYTKKYYHSNIDKIKINRKENHKKRWIYDPLYKLKISLRNSLNKIFKKNYYSKKLKSTEIYGCTYEFLLKYIENKFEAWMTWDNYGKYNGELNYGWDIDHIKPVSIAKTKEEIIELCHYSNLQPLCSKVNRDIKKHFY